MVVDGLIGSLVGAAGSPMVEGDPIVEGLFVVELSIVDGLFIGEVLGDVVVLPRFRLLFLSHVDEDVGGVDVDGDVVDCVDVEGAVVDGVPIVDCDPIPCGSVVVGLPIGASLPVEVLCASAAPGMIRAAAAIRLKVFMSDAPVIFLIAAINPRPRIKFTGSTI